MKRKLTKKQFKEKEQRLAKKKEAKKGVKELDLVIPRIPKISQSLIKALAKYRNDEECGLVIDHIYIKGQWLPSSKAQELGNYFEYICTGGLPRDKHIPEPKLLKTGKPSIDYARMDKQKENFEAMMYEYGFEIEHTGYEFTNPKYSGIADIIEETPLPDAVKDAANLIFDREQSGNISFWTVLDTLDVQEDDGGRQVQNFLLYVFYNSMTDEMRELFANKDYSEKGRRANIDAAQKIAHYLHNQGKDVIVSLVSPYRDQREEFKTNLDWQIKEFFVHYDISKVKRGREHFHVNEYQAPIEKYTNINTTQDTPEQSLDNIKI